MECEGEIRDKRLIALNTSHRLYGLTFTTAHGLVTFDFAKIFTYDMLIESLCNGLDDPGCFSYRSISI